MEGSFTRYPPGNDRIPIQGVIENDVPLFQGGVVPLKSNEMLDLLPTQDSSHHQDYYIFSRESL